MPDKKMSEINDLLKGGEFVACGCRIKAHLMMTLSAVKKIEGNPSICTDSMWGKIQADAWNVVSTGRPLR